MTAHEDLPPKYALSFYLGEIVRNDAWAENETKALWGTLRQADIGEGECERDFARVLRQVRAQLRDDRVPAQFAKLGGSVLDATASAHQKRRAYVHDILIQTPWDGGRVRSAAGSGLPIATIEEIAQYADDLRIVVYRLRALWVIAPSWVGGERDKYDDRAALISWTRVAMGHVADDPGQIRGTDGPALEPPGGY